MWLRLGLGVQILTVFALCAFGAWIVAGFVVPLWPRAEPPPAERPTPPPYAPFRMVLSVSSAPASIVINTDGDCFALAKSQRLLAACSLAINADPAVIGGAALGHLNMEPTPSLDALTWRATLDRDPSVCGRGGLEGAFRTQCETQAGDAYELSDSGLTISLLTSLAAGSPAPS